jgi:acyl-CoA dehydrogenase
VKLTFDETQEHLAETARSFVQSTTPIDRVRRLRDTKDPVGYSPKLWKEMAELGWTGICLPEEYGGSALGFVELCIVLEEAGRRLVPEPLVSTVLLGAQALLLGGTAEHKERWLPNVAAGAAVLTVAYQETGSRYDVRKLETVAERTSSGYRLTGKKVHVLDGHVANALVVSARGESGVSLFLVDAKSPGLSFTPTSRIDSRNAAEVRLESVLVPASSLVGEAGLGAELLTRVVDRATVGLAAEMLGGATQAFEDTLTYLKSRKQFGVTLGSFQALQHRAARLFIELSLARSAVVAAARTVDESPERVPRMASLAKARVSDVFVQVANEAVQMHGGIGVTDEFHLGFYIKRARVAEMTFGDGAFHRKRWAELAGY